MMSFWQEYTKFELEYICIKNLVKPLGLIREPWQYSRGAKTERHYKKDGITYIKVAYSYSYADNGQDLRSITSYSEIISLLESDGSVFHSITVPSSLNAKNLKDINRAIRVGRLDYLLDMAEQSTISGNALPASVDQQTLDQLITDKSVHPNYNTPALYLVHRQNLIDMENNMEVLFAHYNQEIYDYKDRGVPYFWDAVNAEIDPTILAILNTDLPPDSVFINGFMVIDAIKYQLRAVLN